jgi:hypothetical protein
MMSSNAIRNSDGPKKRKKKKKKEKKERYSDGVIEFETSMHGIN